MASQAAVYVHAITMLSERAEVVAANLNRHPADAILAQEHAALHRSLRLFRARLQRTEELARVNARRG